METDDDYQGEAPVPSQKEVEQYLVEQRRKQVRLYLLLYENP